MICNNPCKLILERILLPICVVHFKCTTYNIAYLVYPESLRITNSISHWLLKS